ncbi:hypothetical protein FIU92_00345 [Ruegeria sp. THAF33]|nr:hypothetical protein FIU92_00345 [Ruegeria sp. THAF33]
MVTAMGCDLTVAARCAITKGLYVTRSYRHLGMALQSKIVGPAFDSLTVSRIVENATNVTGAVLAYCAVEACVCPVSRCP